MDSHYFNPSSSRARPRADSTFSITTTTDSGNIRKQSLPRLPHPRSISAAQLERNPDLLPEDIQNQLHLSPSLSNTVWTSQHPSPRTAFPQHPQAQGPSIAPQLAPNLAPATGTQSHTTTPNSSAEYALRVDPPTTSATNMASLGYLPPPHFGSMAFHDPAFDQNYQSLDSHSSTTSAGNIFLSESIANQPIYAPGPMSMEPSYSGSSPAFSTSSIEPSLTHISDPALRSAHRHSSPFPPSSYDTMDYSSMAGQQVPGHRTLSHSPLPPPQMGSMSPPLNTLERSTSLFEGSMYGPQFTAAPVQHSLYQPPPSFSYPPPQQLGSNIRHPMSRMSGEPQVRVLNQKPKPQCWDHGCNGREFSTFSNLLRHQREKSGTAAKSYCPKCGAEFTRTTARNGHLAHEKCSKQRRASEDK